jgi:hypothetical protein
MPDTAGTTTTSNTQSTDIGQDLLNVPFPDMVKNLGLAIAEAQLALDMSSMRIAQFMAGQPQGHDAEGNPTQSVDTSAGKVKFGTQELSLLELGFTPTFYQFVDTVIEVKISISFSNETDTTIKSRSISGGLRSAFGGFGGASLRAASVNATYASKYQYHAEGSSVIRTKLVPVPTPSILEERIRKLIDDNSPTT